MDFYTDKKTTWDVILWKYHDYSDKGSNYKCAGIVKMCWIDQKTMTHVTLSHQGYIDHYLPVFVVVWERALYWDGGQNIGLFLWL